MRYKKFFLVFALLFSLVSGEEIRVLGIGSPSIDYILSVDDAFLEKLSLKKGGWSEWGWEAITELLQTAQDPAVFTGGCTANMIKGLANLGLSCSLIGNIGSDFTGDMISQVFKNLGVNTLFSKKNLKSSQIICLVTPDGERTFCSYILPERNLTEECLNPAYFKDIQLLHLDGYTLRNGIVLERAMKLAKEAHAQVSFDVANAALAVKYRERLFATLSQYVDILFANEEESFALTGLPPKAASIFLKNFCKVSIVKVGANGCFVSSQAGTFHFPGYPTQMVDSTGAGDLFASGFLYGYLKGYPIEICAQFGNASGAQVIENYGAEIPESGWPKLNKKFEQIRCKQSFSPL